MISCWVVPPVGGWYSVLKVRVKVARWIDKPILLFPQNKIVNPFRSLFSI